MNVNVVGTLPPSDFPSEMHDVVLSSLEFVVFSTILTHCSAPILQVPTVCLSWTMTTLKG